MQRIRDFFTSPFKGFTSRSEAQEALLPLTEKRGDRRRAFAPQEGETWVLVHPSDPRSRPVESPKAPKDTGQEITEPSTPSAVALEIREDKKD